MVFRVAGPGAFRFTRTEANGLPALATYRGGELYALHLVRFEGERVREITAFLDTRMFRAFGLPAHL
jgi:hypothetical protein